ncbi:MAG: hypothetical protein M1286_01110 [Candidatus Marsarchaeota archaeon]|nr:hypothetical protein [Candidatus Marsarchaeota archaeon]
MQKSYCIVCGEERRGIPVEDDFVLGSIRWFKRNVTKNERNNKLVVCRSCYPKYISGRKKFESRQKLYIAFGVIFASLNLFISATIYSVLVSVAVLLLLFAFSFLSYTPRISIKKQSNQ